MSKQDEIKKLEELIRYHDNLYYNLDSPKITDAEYDALKRKYYELTGKKEIDDAVPGEPSELFQKYEHKYPVKSLAKINTEEELRKELARLAPGVIQPKLDGLTLVIYPDGAIVTRGNGHIGEDVRHTANKIKNIKIYPDAPVRIEALIDKKTFAEINKKRKEQGLDLFKNPRNTVAGMLRNKDFSKVEGVSYLAYNIMGSELPESAQLQLLKEAGFDVVETFYYTIDTIDEAIKYIMEFDRESYPYEIDGMVIKSDIPNSLKIFGETEHHPKNAVAFKWQAEGKWTKLIDVVYQAGRTGKVVPVAIVEPVEVMGSTISRVTLHNYGIMSALGVSKGCDVYVIKANDVIPAIIQTRNYDPVNKIEKITKCPVCSSDLVEINDQQFCQNPECKAKLLYNICHLAERNALDIEGLSEETARKMIKQGLVNHQFDIFDLTKEQIKSLDGFAEKSATKLYNNIQKARETTLKQFIYAAGIPNIGRTASEELANTFGSYDELIKDVKENNCQRISEINGFGHVLIDSIKRHSHLLIKLREKVTPKNVGAKRNQNQLTFVITGTLPNPRKYYEDLIKNAGHKIYSSVSKNTNYVLVGENPGSKLSKAQELGIPILRSEEELKEVLEQYENTNS